MTPQTREQYSSHASAWERIWKAESWCFPRARNYAGGGMGYWRRVGNGESGMHSHARAWERGR